MLENELPQAHALLRCVCCFHVAVSLGKEYYTTNATESDHNHAPQSVTAGTALSMRCCHFTGGRERLTGDSLIHFEPSEGGYLEDVGSLAHVRERDFGSRSRPAGIVREQPCRRSDNSFAGHGPLTDRDAIIERNEKRVGISAKKGVVGQLREWRDCDGALTPSR